MENRLWLNQNRSSYEGLFIFFVFEGILVFTSDGWDVVIGGAIIMFLAYLVMTKFRTMLFIDKKVIVKRTIWFKKIELKLLEIVQIDFIESSTMYSSDSLKLVFKGGNDCYCFNLKEGEFIVLFNEIYDSIDFNQIRWNKRIEEFEPFVKSKFGELIKRD